MDLKIPWKELGSEVAAVPRCSPIVLLALVASVVVAVVIIPSGARSFIRYRNPSAVRRLRE